MKHRLYQSNADEVSAARDKVHKKDRSFAERAADPDNKELFEQGLVSVPRNWPKPPEELKVKWAREDRRQVGEHLARTR